ncbi:CaiB/BaiF CoA transferase family protein [Daeguia caeni]|uniref:CaiB/BaiF CoA transferase family protein n=1 Tax=Daeguia caeni TaxID=439612 RepID=A0ABV9H0V8_9HYPH
MLDNSSITDNGNQANPDAPLAGIVVIDVTHMLSGPYCTWVLGALGATVIKVERPVSGDFTRIVAPFDKDESIYFLSVNRNKRSITINLKCDEGKAIFRDLVKKADVLVENNRAGVMDRLGLGYKDLKAINPELVYTSISGFGQSGPYSGRAAFDVIAQALSGMMSITGEPDRGPARVGASIGDIASSLFAVIGILANLLRRGKIGQGAFVDVAMLDCQLALLENAIARAAITGEEPRRLGSRHPLIAPFQAFPTADKPLAICVDTQAQWERLCKAMDLEHLFGVQHFATGSSRAAHHAELEPILIERFLTKTRDEWLDILDKADVPSSAINSVSEAINDPQVQHRGMVAEVPEGSGRRFVRLPIIQPDEKPLPEFPAPKLGEHTEEILAELGFTPEDVKRLRENGAV